MNNQVIDTIMARRSIRAYTDEALTNEQIDALCKVALTSPTAVNAQGWHFSFLNNTSLINEMEADIVDVIMKGDNEAMKERIKSRNNKVIYNAPLLVVISYKESNFSGVDSGIAVQSLAIAAKAMGLDNIILGMLGLVFKGPKAEYWKEKLQFPEGHEFVIGIAIGHGAMEPAEKVLDTSKLCIIE